MTGEEQIQSVESQVVLMTRGKVNALSCPYCGALTPAGKTLCCLLFVNAIAAVLQRIDFERNKEIAEEAMEKATKN